MFAWYCKSKVITPDLWGFRNSNIFICIRYEAKFLFIYLFRIDPKSAKPLPAFIRLDSPIESISLSVARPSFSHVNVVLDYDFSRLYLEFWLREQMGARAGFACPSLVCAPHPPLLHFLARLSMLFGSGFAGLQRTEPRLSPRTQTATCIELWAFFFAVAHFVPKHSHCIIMFESAARRCPLTLELENTPGQA